MTRASSIRKANFPRALSTGVAAALIALGVVAQPSPARAAPPPTVLDQFSPVDAAAFGDTLAWLRAVEVRNEEVRRTALVVRDGAGATPRVLIGRLPKDTQSLALGSDRDGQSTVVLVCPRGLFTVATDGPARLRRVPGTRPDDAAPALRKGVLSFSRARQAGGRGHITVRVGSLTSGRSRQIWSVPSADTSLGDTALGTDHTVLFETTRFGHANVWTSALRIMRAGKRSRILLRQQSRGDDAGLGRATVSADGTRASVTRWNQSGNHPTDQTVFSLPTPSQLAHSGLPELPLHPTINSLIPLTSGASAAVTDSGPFYLVR